MATITMGREPDDLIIIFTLGGNYRVTLVLSELWPPGSSIALLFPSDPTTEVWDAAIDGFRASWNVAAATVEGLMGDRRRRLVRLRYVDSDSVPDVWAVGEAYAY